jgi:tellurite resistance protein TerC
MALRQADSMTSIKRKRYAGFPNVSTLRVAKRIVVAIIGGTVTLIGIALIVLPGPAIIVIPIGLSILATEFLWAKRWLNGIRQMADRLRTKKTPPAA